MTHDPGSCACPSAGALFRTAMHTLTFLRQNFSALIAGILLLFGASCATSGPRGNTVPAPRGYTADMVVSAAGATTTSRIKIQGSRMRMEVLTGRRSSIMIVDYDRLKAWVLVPAEGKYKEVPFESLGDQIPHFFMPGLQIEKTTLREEDLDGVPAVRYHAVIACDDGAGYTGSLWESRDLPEFPLKWVDNASNVVVTWRNVRSIDLSSSFFEIPPGYSELAGEIRVEAGRGKRSCRGFRP